LHKEYVYKNSIKNNTCSIHTPVLITININIDTGHVAALIGDLLLRHHVLNKPTVSLPHNILPEN
jgi:hypothetical protein